MLPFAQLDPADLAGQGLWQVVDELDAPRVRVLREAQPHEVGDLSRKFIARLVIGGEDDERLDDGAATLVGRRYRRCLSDGRMLDTG